MRPIRRETFGFDQARHLLWRAGFGGTPEQIRTLVAWGPEQAVDHLLEIEKVPDAPPDETLFDRDLMRPPTREEQRQIAVARRTQDEETLARLRVMRMDRERRDRLQVRQMQRWWLIRLIETPRPLEEKMVLFWHGHFATSYRGVEDSFHMYLQNLLFRRHALGNFAELLYGIIRDPAMLAYLNNNQSRRRQPNENLARELMELFSLGLGAYSEDDIREGARALTGYTFEDDQFVFRARDHDDNPKTILGQRGRFNGDDFVGLILQQPACPRFIARKLYKFFVADIPPWEAADNDRHLDPAARRVIADLASTLSASRYALRPVLRRLFLSEHFYDPAIMNQRIKSPVELVVGAVRSLHVPTRDLSILLDALDLMGQNLFFPPSVKGWDGGRGWINTSTLYVRQNVLAYLLTGRKPGGDDPLADTERYDPAPMVAALVGDATTDPDAVITSLLRFMVGSVPPDAHAVLRRVVPSAEPVLSRDTLIKLMLLISAMPEYQLC